MYVEFFYETDSIDDIYISKYIYVQSWRWCGTKQPLFQFRHITGSASGSVKELEGVEDSDSTRYDRIRGRKTSWNAAAFRILEPDSYNPEKWVFRMKDITSIFFSFSVFETPFFRDYRFVSDVSCYFAIYHFF